MAPVATVLLVLLSTSVATRMSDSEHTKMSLMNDEMEAWWAGVKKKPTKLIWNVASMVFFGVLPNREVMYAKTILI